MHCAVLLDFRPAEDLETTDESALMQGFLVFESDPCKRLDAFLPGSNINAWLLGDNRKADCVHLTQVTKAISKPYNLRCEAQS